MSDLGGEALLILLLVAVNGLLAMSEIAVVSARKSRLRQRAGEGDAGAATALALAAEPTRFLSTVQIGITLVGILAGAFGGATMAEEIGLLLDGVPIVGPYGDAIGLAVVVAAITYLSLIFGELVPKRVGLAHAEVVATRVARPMRALSKAAGPIVGLLSGSTEAVLRLLRVRTASDTTVTEDEVRMMLAEGTEAGIFQVAEREIVEGAFRFADRRVGELMVPRPRIAWLDADDPADVRLQRLVAGGHSFYPVVRGDLDQLLGIVSVKHLVAELLAGPCPDLTAALVQPTFVPETMTALQLLERFRVVSPRVALVVDEHGTISGLVTPTDILEAIVGDLPEIGDDASAEAVRRDDGSWLVDGLMPIEALHALLDLDDPPTDEHRRFRTVGGLVMHHLGRVPSAGDTVVLHGLRLEVLDMDGRRVDKLMVLPQTLAHEQHSPAGRSDDDARDA